MRTFTPRIVPGGPVLFDLEPLRPPTRPSACPAFLPHCTLQVLALSSTLGTQSFEAPEGLPPPSLALTGIVLSPVEQCLKFCSADPERQEPQRPRLLDRVSPYGVSTRFSLFQQSRTHGSQSSGSQAVGRDPFGSYSRYLHCDS